jgi:hypothetical protein
MVLLVPLALRVVLTTSVPVDTLVSIILVEVTLTVVIVPPIIRFPERLILLPVNVVPDTRVEVTVLKVPDVANKVAEVIPVEALIVPILALVMFKLLTVVLLANNDPVEMLVVANKVAVVIPVDKLIVPMLALVI